MRPVLWKNFINEKVSYLVIFAELFQKLSSIFLKIAMILILRSLYAFKLLSYGFRDFCYSKDRENVGAPFISICSSTLCEDIPSLLKDLHSVKITNIIYSHLKWNRNHFLLQKLIKDLAFFSSSAHMFG